MTAAAPPFDPSTLAFLGREFLTWLWYRCEVDGGVFALQGGEVGVVLNEYASLVATGEGEEQSIIKRSSAHRSPEARTALRSGKVVSAARLELAREDRAFSVTISGDTFDVRSVRYPNPQADDLEEKDLERLAAMEELSEILDGLFELFLSVRTTDAWEQTELPAMEAWVLSGREEPAPRS